MLKSSFLITACIAALASLATPNAFAQGYNYNSANPYGQQKSAAQQPGYSSSTFQYGQAPQQAAPVQQPQAQQARYQPGYGPQPFGSDVAPVRYEEYISPAEQPGRNAARTVAAGGMGTFNRPINFPRDPGDDVDVLKLQVYLDYNGFSPGEIDGRWGYNTERALYVYQKENGMTPTGQLDSTMLQRLNSFTDGYLLDYTVTSEDMKGPFHPIPRTYPEQAKLKWLPYETKAEAMAEKFHMAQALLRKLNPGIDLEQLQPGSRILALNVINGADDKRGKVSLVRVSKYNKWVEGYDSAGKLLFYYPSTLGSEYDPLPLGDYKITQPVFNPDFEYNPKLMWDSKPGEKEESIPPGPNSPVGAVWIGTTRPNVGIHGTPNPENISKNNSHGCIRLCNWDAKQLASRVSPGIKLEFVK